jgi:hypothetical protein
VAGEPENALRADEVSDLWTKYESNPVLGPTVMFGQLALKPGGGWYFFGGYQNSIHRWESADLITWSNRVEVLASGGEGAWDEFLYVALAFQKPDESWVMFYRGSDGSANQIGRATSADGTIWVRHDNSGVDDGLFPQFGSNYDPTGIILANGTYYLYVNGTGGHGVTNLYMSTDLDTWTAHPGNPIFNNGFCSYVWKYDGYYYMLIPRDIVLAGSALYDHAIALYRSASPVFTRTNRQYLGCVIVNDQLYDDRYLDVPTIPMTDINRDTYAAEFGATFWVMYSGDLTGITQNLANTTQAGLAVRTVIAETGSEL